jgi:GntR family transcriptional regulator, rspAB operon transcriptional repressor
MEFARVDTQRAYELIWDKITTCQLAPGATIDPGQLAEELQMGLTSVREAIWLLAHENLVLVTPRHGLYVAEVNLPDLEYLSELRLLLEAQAARLAAQRATPDDLVVLETLRAEQARVPAEDRQGLFELDHKFHLAMARATQNRYLAQTLNHLFGMSRRLWYMALPKLGFLPMAVEQHLDLVFAIKTCDPDRAEAVMRGHVQDFYTKVREVLYTS